jgi:hypothetical protein
MLEALERAAFAARVHRLVNLSRDAQTLGQMVDAQAVAEVLQLMAASGLGPDPLEMIRRPFVPKAPGTGRPSRFSDGNVLVFYSALEHETAEAEITSLCRRTTFDGLRVRATAYYRFGACDFAGDVKDLRPYADEWAFLYSADESGYPQCQAIGGEAVSENLDALQTRSARRAEGTTLPVFRQGALANPTLNDYWAITFEPADGSIDVDRAP